jgi:hypothetical protein
VVASAPGEQLLLAEDPALGRRAWLGLRPPSAPALGGARREVARTGRLRWLAAGRHGDRPWDAFLAPSGCPLAELVRATGPLAWPDAGPLLLGLAQELAAASADGTLPESLTTAQVWVQSGGRVLLLDALPGAPAAPGAGQPLELLRQVAALLLEGRPRNPAEPPRPARAALPGPAARAVGRLFGVGAPYDTAEEARAALETAVGQPAEVTPGRRLWHLVLVTACLSLGLFGCIAPWTVFVSEGHVAIQRLDMAKNRCTLALERLHEGAPADLATGLASPDPWTRLAAAARWDADQRLARRVERNRRALRAERVERLEEMSWVVRTSLAFQEAPSGRMRRSALRYLKHRAGGADDDFRADARGAAEMLTPARVARGAGDNYVLLLGPLVFWPLAWVLWAFVTRGGLSYRLAGIALVRGDGRPASRLQCLARAFLVWAPVTALLVLSACLDEAYWSVWRVPALRASHVWLELLSKVCWWAAWAVLAGCVALALRHPARSWHDRLAGTYLVPR